MPHWKTGSWASSLLQGQPCSCTGLWGWFMSSISLHLSFCCERWLRNLHLRTAKHIQNESIINLSIYAKILGGLAKLGYICCLFQVLRPGVLWFLRNLNDPDFNPVQEMIHLPIYRHLRRFILSVVSAASLGDPVFCHILYLVFTSTGDVQGPSCLSLCFV